MLERIIAKLKKIKEKIVEKLPKSNPDVEFHWEDDGHVRTTYKGGPDNRAGKGKRKPKVEKDEVKEFDPIIKVEDEKTDANT